MKTIFVVLGFIFFISGIICNVIGYWGCKNYFIGLIFLLLAMIPFFIIAYKFWG